MISFFIADILKTLFNYFISSYSYHSNEFSSGQIIDNSHLCLTMMTAHIELLIIQRFFHFYVISVSSTESTCWFRLVPDKFTRGKPQRDLRSVPVSLD